MDTSPPLNVDPGELREIEQRFHQLIRDRAGHLVEGHHLELPQLAASMMGQEAAWFPVPGMYGGFSYRLAVEAGRPTLLVSSWSRVVGGSGQQHAITSESTTLTDEGFV